MFVDVICKRLKSLESWHDAIGYYLPITTPQIILLSLYSLVQLAALL